MDTPTAHALTEARAALDHLTAEIAALIRRIEDLEAHQYATGQGVSVARLPRSDVGRAAAVRLGYSVLGHSRGGRFAGARCQKARQGRQMSRCHSYVAKSAIAPHTPRKA